MLQKKRETPNPPRSKQICSLPQLMHPIKINLHNFVFPFYFCKTNTLEPPLIPMHLLDSLICFSYSNDQVIIISPNTTLMFCLSKILLMTVCILRNNRSNFIWTFCTLLETLLGCFGSSSLSYLPPKPLKTQFSSTAVPAVLQSTLALFFFIMSKCSGLNLSTPHENALHLLSCGVVLFSFCFCKRFYLPLYLHWQYTTMPPSWHIC